MKFTNAVHFLLDGEAVILTKIGVSLHDVETHAKKNLVIQRLDWKVEDAEKGGYPHFLLKEIMEQKKTIPKTSQINIEELQKIAERIKIHKKVVMTACGTASYCALAAKYFFAKSGIQAQSYPAYEFLPFAKFCDKDTVFIAISQSGETADTLIAARAAKK